jgi:hypothetical protein
MGIGLSPIAAGSGKAPIRLGSPRWIGESPDSAVRPQAWMLRNACVSSSFVRSTHACVLYVMVTNTRWRTDRATWCCRRMKNPEKLANSKKTPLVAEYCYGKIAYKRADKPAK